MPFCGLNIKVQWFTPRLTTFVGRVKITNNDAFRSRGGMRLILSRQMNVTYGLPKGCEGRIVNREATLTYRRRRLGHVKQRSLRPPDGRLHGMPEDTESDRNRPKIRPWPRAPKLLSFLIPFIAMAFGSDCLGVLIIISCQ